MSVLRRKPYIETLLATLSGEQITALETAMNSNAGDDSFYSLVDKNNYIPAGATIKCIRLEVEKDKPAYTGILIKTSNDCVLIAYHRFQDLAIFEIDNVNKQYTRIKEYLDINELRRCVDDAKEKVVPDIEVTASVIKSGTATNGQVLTANGEGGAIWADAGSDILSQIEYGYDEEMDVTSIAFPAGILPLRCIDENIPFTLYFDYDGGVVINDQAGDGSILEEVGPIVYNSNTGKYSADINGSISLIHMLYLSFSGTDDSRMNFTFNTYDLLNYKPLYRYDVYITSRDSMEVSFNFVSSNRNLVPGATESARFSNLVSCLNSLGYNSADKFLSCCGLDTSDMILFDRVYADITNERLYFNGANTTFLFSDEALYCKVTVTKLK